MRSSNPPKILDTEEEDILIQYVLGFLASSSTGRLYSKDVGVLADQVGLTSISGVANFKQKRRSEIMNKMARRGLVVKHGNRGGAYYTLPEEHEFVGPLAPEPEPLAPEPEPTPRAPEIRTGFVHQGKHWTVVAAQAGNTYPALDFLEGMGPKEAAGFLKIIHDVADTPLGNIKNNSFKCFSYGGGTLCEIRKTTSHRRLFLIRHRNQIVLLHGFSKKANKTPRRALIRASDLRAAHIARNPRNGCRTGWLAWITEVNARRPW